jgi:hypothetical protein
LDVIDFFSASVLGCTLLLEAAFDFRFVLTILVLLSWIVTARRAATTTTPRRPSGAGGGKEQVSEKSGFAEMVDIDGIQKRGDSPS